MNERILFELSANNPTQRKVSEEKSSQLNQCVYVYKNGIDLVSCVEMRVVVVVVVILT